MRLFRYFLLSCCVFGLLPMLGCGGPKPTVRHLSSEVCLLLPGKMSQNDVIGVLGDPSVRRTEDDGRIVWFYYQGHESTMRKTPLIGKKLGEEEYDVVTITFDGDTLLACVYRSLDEKEFNEAGIVDKTEK